MTLREFIEGAKHAFALILTYALIAVIILTLFKWDII